MEIPTKDLFRQLNALVRTQNQRNYIVQQLELNQGLALDKRHDGFHIIDGNLKFTMPNNDVLQVIMSVEQVKEAIEDAMEKDMNVGKGINNLYFHLKFRYLNITREDVKNHMQTNERHVLSQKPKARVNQSITTQAKYPGAIFAIDLIEMSEQYNADNTVTKSKVTKTSRNSVFYKKSTYNYIFSAMDVFSRKIFLVKLKKKESKLTTKAFQDVIKRADIPIKSIIADNGTEFKGEFATFCKDNKIKIRLTREYSPTSNPVERSNREIRETMRGLLIKNGNLEWHTQLKKIEASRNSSYHSALHTSPDKVFSGDDDPMMEEITERNKVDAKAKQDKFKVETYEPGDKVFVAMSAIYSHARSKIKAGHGKDLVIKYQPKIYRVTKVIKPSETVIGRPRYTLQMAYYPYHDLCNESLKKNADGTQTRQYIPSRLYSSDLVPCTLTNSELSISVSQAMKINGLNKTRLNDLVTQDLDLDDDDDGYF